MGVEAGIFLLFMALIDGAWTGDWVRQDYISEVCFSPSSLLPSLPPSLSSFPLYFGFMLHVLTPPSLPPSLPRTGHGAIHEVLLPPSRFR